MLDPPLGRAQALFLYTNLPHDCMSPQLLLDDSTLLLSDREEVLNRGDNTSKYIWVLCLSKGEQSVTDVGHWCRSLGMRLEREV